MKKLIRTLVIFGGALVIFWTSVMVIFAKNYDINSPGMMLHTSVGVDPYMAIMAAGLAGLAGILVFIRRNVINKG